MRIFVALAACLCLAGSVFAAPISPINTRPVSIESPIDGPSAEGILDSLFGVDVVEDDQQQIAGYFRVANPGSMVIAPQLKVVNGFAKSFGLFTLPGLDDTNAIEIAELFPDSASTTAVATVIWDSRYTGSIVLVDGGVTVTPFSGIDRLAFGFWAKVVHGTPGATQGGTSDTIVYTLDGLNDPTDPSGGTAKVLAYSDGGSNWAFLFETDSYNDYNEGAILVESLAPNPEPGTFVLIGAGAIAAFVIRRRRRSNA
ncbi:MAG: PEP-CTERM sorting domain-containing protein [Planctomycetota bacterium]|jgi:hypothetical protein